MTRSAVLPALLAGTLAACDQVDPRVPRFVSVSPALATANTVGETIPYRAQVRDSDGEVIYEADIHWSSGNTRIATVSSTGVATVTGHGTVLIWATHGRLSGSGQLDVIFTPARLVRTAGDSQTAPGLARLPVDPAVRVEDASGLPIPGVQVSFGVAPGNGEVDPAGAVSDSAGIASTRWTLGQREGGQRMSASVNGISTDFMATATAPKLTITTRELDRARVTVAYRDRLAFLGLHSPPLTWSVTEGTLPPGILLDSTGVLAGTATEPGATDFTVTVRDAAGSSDSRSLALRVCDAPLRLQTGDVLTLGHDDFAPCPPMLPAGLEGDRYRVAAVHASVVAVGSPPTLTVSVRAVGGNSDPAAHAPGSPDGPAAHQSGTELPPGALELLPPGLAAGVRMARTTAWHHATLFAEAERLVQSLGTGAILPDTRSSPTVGATGAASMRAPPERIAILPYRVGSTSCSPPGPTPVPALLVGHSDHLAIYQDSVQRDSIPVSTQHAQAVVDYYDAYGAGTIAEFFGDVPDINSDERVNVFVSRVVPSDVAAFVWPGDFLARNRCAASNEMELVYINQSLFSALGAPVETRHYLALPTPVHEVKHLTSLHHRLATDTNQPAWIEEGTAEIASEISSRKAMEATGGVARGAMLRRDAYPPRDGSIITPENYGMLVALARTTVSYAAPINSIIGDYSEGHTYYGTAWHFHRFLGDAYGGAAQSRDGELFSALNTELPAGRAGIEQATGTPIPALLEEYAAAMMLNGTDAPQPSRSFATYDFPSATFQLFRPQGQPAGLYPWPGTGPAPAPFRTATHIAFLAPGGIRFHDFESDGAGTGIELVVSAGSLTDLRVVIARLR